MWANSAAKKLINPTFSPVPPELPKASMEQGSKVATFFKAQLRTLSMVIALIAIWVTFYVVTDGAFLQPRNLSNLFRQMAITGILATGMVLVIVAGFIDLSIGSMVAFIGAFLAILITEHAVHPTLAFGLALLVGVLFGALQGYLTTYQKIPAFIVTLGGMMALRGASMWVTKGNTIALGDNWIQELGSNYLASSWGWALCATVCGLLVIGYSRNFRIAQSLGVNSHSGRQTIIIAGAIILGIFGFMKVLSLYQGIPYPVLLMLGLMVCFHFIATQTTFGRHIYALGGNKEAAHMSGINTKLHGLGVFLLMGLLSAIGAVVLTARVGSASPDAGQLLELDAIASCVIGGTSLAGGRGSIFGAILGALVMESLNNGMSLTNMEAFWQYIVKGTVLVAAVWVDSLSQPKS